MEEGPDGGKGQKRARSGGSGADNEPAQEGSAPPKNIRMQPPPPFPGLAPGLPAGLPDLVTSSSSSPSSSPSPSPRTPSKRRLGDHTASELRGLLRAKGLSDSGKKQALLKRLKASQGQSVLASFAGKVADTVSNVASSPARLLGWIRQQPADSASETSHSGGEGEGGGSASDGGVGAEADESNGGELGDGGTDSSGESDGTAARSRTDAIGEDGDGVVTLASGADASAPQ